MISELLDDRQTKLQREVVDARHGVNFCMVNTKLLVKLFPLYVHLCVIE